MKLVKRIASMILCACLMVPCLAMVANAATPGKILVTEQTAQAGDEVTVSLKAHVDAGIGNRTITISYDSNILQFVSASNTTKVSDGELKYESQEGINSLYNETELDKLTFKALKEGTATISVKSAEVASSFEITWTYYDGKVAVSGGTTVPTTPDTETPDADTEVPSDDTEMPSDDTEVPSDDTEVPTDADAEIIISNSTTINLISDISSVILPDRYMETSVKMNGKEYPAWQDTENTDMYILYATSSNGVKSLYQYDVLENTYQRFEVSAGTTVVAGESNFLSIFGDKANYVIIGAGALLVLFIIIVIVLSVKLYNRNAELDEVYDDLDNALAEKEVLRKASASRANVMPVQPVQVETEDDVILSTEEMEEDEDDSEVEVEFYVDESIQDFFAEEAVKETVKETVEEAVKKEPAVEYYDEEDDFYDDLDGDFTVSFIDLD